MASRSSCAPSPEHWLTPRSVLALRERVNDTHVDSLDLAVAHAAVADPVAHT
ncbi:MAG TPA: hypothetical protein VK894_06165 [Jiangellales bacterium]|nr:hypothetical protein [Jiangellales bacterium]